MRVSRPSPRLSGTARYSICQDLVGPKSEHPLSEVLTCWNLEEIGAVLRAHLQFIVLPDFLLGRLVLADFGSVRNPHRADPDHVALVRDTDGADALGIREPHRPDRIDVRDTDSVRQARQIHGLDELANDQRLEEPAEDVEGAELAEVRHGERLAEFPEADRRDQAAAHHYREVGLAVRTSRLEIGHLHELAHDRAGDRSDGDAAQGLKARARAEPLADANEGLTRIHHRLAEAIGDVGDAGQTGQALAAPTGTPTGPSALTTLLASGLPTLAPTGDAERAQTFVRAVAVHRGQAHDVVDVVTSEAGGDLLEARQALKAAGLGPLHLAGNPLPAADGRDALPASLGLTATALLAALGAQPREPTLGRPTTPTGRLRELPTGLPREPATAPTGANRAKTEIEILAHAQLQSAIHDV